MNARQSGAKFGTKFIINYDMQCGLLMVKARHNGDVTNPQITRAVVVVATTDVRPAVVNEQDTTEITSTDRPWIVIVWNDPINLMSYVTFVFQKLFGYSLEKATELMLDVHHKGRAVVSSGPRERAEFDVYRLHEHGLWATMQKDSNSS
jgi:ATP-dependent Clp protease adaptor protein ClpS